MIEFFFDCSNPWTYLAFHNIQPLAAEFGAQITWRPILVGGIFNTINPSVYEGRAHPVPAKARYIRQGPAGLGARGGAEDQDAAQRLPGEQCQGDADVPGARGGGQRFPSRPPCSRPIGARIRTFRRTRCCAELRARVGLDADAVLAAQAGDEIKAQLRANTDEVMARGGFGSPTIFVGGNDMYFGNDRLPLVRAAMERRDGGHQGRSAASPWRFGRPWSYAFPHSFASFIWDFSLMDLPTSARRRLWRSRSSSTGAPRQVAVDVRTTLLDLLREHLGLPGTKKGCDHGPVRGVHGAGRRAADQFVPVAGDHARGRERSPPSRGSAAGEPASAAGGVPRPRRVPVRLLHARARSARRRDAGGGRRGEASQATETWPPRPSRSPTRKSVNG